MIRFLTFLLGFLSLFFLACNNGIDKTTDDDQLGVVMDGNNPKVDVISGYCRDDLLLVFEKEVLHHVDSAFNSCMNILVKSNMEIDYSQKLMMISNTSDFVSAKIDRFEKFGNYEMDETCKIKMIDALSIYIGIISSEFQELAFITSTSSVISKNEQKATDSIIDIIGGKMLLKDNLINEILSEYNHLHNKT